MASPLIVTDNSVEGINRALIDLSGRIPGASTSTPSTVIAVTGTAAVLTANNPTLQAGEIGLETDTNYFKIGDGSTAWSSLSYQSVKNAPLPQTASGVGQEVNQILPGNGNALVAPAGGTWRLYYAGFVTATGAWNYPLACSIAAGGTTVGSAVAGNSWTAVAWRIA